MHVPNFFWNYLDDQFIGETMGNTYFITDVEPGRHYVVVETENTCVADLNFSRPEKDTSFVRGSLWEFGGPEHPAFHRSVLKKP